MVYIVIHTTPLYEFVIHCEVVGYTVVHCFCMFRICYVLLDGVDYQNKTLLHSNIKYS